MPTDDASVPNAPQPPAPGEGRFGRYQTDSDGTVHDRLLDRPVTLRCVSSVEADELQHEARFYARLHHPGLPNLIDYVRDDAGAALVMSPVVGLTLAAAVTARASGAAVPAIADATACTLTFITLCDALGAAHLRGVVHCAIAPEAIILGDDGQIVLEGWAKAMKTVDRPLNTRLCAHVPVPATLAADDLHQDIRGLGACLFTALVGTAPPRSDDGRLAVLDPAAAARVPGPLLAILRKALASNAAEGYPAVAAMRADLVRFLAGQQPQSEAPLVPLATRLRTAAAFAGIALLVIGVIVALNWHSVSTYATWGAPMVEENFTSEAWKSRWGSRGRWEQRDGRIFSAAEYECALILKQRLSPPVAIEYTGRFNSDVHAGDLSVWWCEDDPFALRADDDVDNANAWFVQAGAYNNSWCTIWQTPARLRSQVNSLVLKPDRDYRFRVEIESDRLRMWIDGKLVLEHHELVPIGSGNIGLYTWDPGKQFDDVRIWQKAVPELVSPLSIGDEFLRAGRLADAADAYARIAASHRGRPLGVEALYFQGLALHRQGSRALARKTWQGMPDGILRQQADCLTIDDLIDEGDMANAIDRFTTWWRDRPQVRDILRQRWQVCGQRLRKMHPRRVAEMDAWIKLRDDTFADDRASRWLVAEMLNMMNRWEETVRRFPDEYRTVAKALVALGRNDELLAAPWALPSERLNALGGLGDLEALLQSRDLGPGARADYLCKAGRAAEAARIAPYPAKLYFDRAGIDEMLARDALGKNANAALLALGRLEEAAGAGVPGSPLSGKSVSALILLGRLDEAEQVMPETDLRVHRLFAHLVAGRIDEARRLREGLTFNPNRYTYTAWIGQGPGMAMIDIALGSADSEALRKALEKGAKSPNGWGGRCALVCAAALDPSKEAAVSAMPWRTEAAAWLRVAQALRGELAGDRAAALTAWRAYASLPTTDRLLEGHTLCVEMEAFVAWRIAMLSQAP